MITAILQARATSSRLPGKVLKPILGKAMLLHQIERILRAQKIDRLVVATSTEASDDAIEELCEKNKVAVFRGSLEDVLDRFYQAALAHPSDHYLRLTGDCPLTDPSVIDQLIDLHQKGSFDYSSNVEVHTYPDGLDCEIVSSKALEKGWRGAKLKSEREHVTPYFYHHPELFKLGRLKQTPDLSALRWTVDEAEDFEFVTKIYEALYPKNPAFGMEAILDLLNKNESLSKINQRFTRNEGFKKSMKKDLYFERYKKSQVMLERAQKVIPLGSQTFSKSRTQYPSGVSPYFIAKAKGCRVWDVDGNEYIDFVSSLGAITLGHADPDVNQAVSDQMRDGVIFSLPHPIETRVAEKIVEMVPCAEMVRFGKNGSDATSGAVRLARAYTRRDRVAVCGYHGWQDWYIGSTARSQGVPQAVKDLTHTFVYNDIESLNQVLKKHPDEFACVVMEPMSAQFPKDGFLEKVKELTHKNGALLVFDEVITGFRFSNGGAQEYFGVTPDLATFGKGMANGYPISVVAGKAEYMKLMEEIFFSFTNGGEAISLAAAEATLKKLQTQPVLRQIATQGEQLISGVNKLLEKHSLQEAISISGHPSWALLTFKNAGKYDLNQIKTLFLQEVFAKGILTIGSHNLGYCHREEEIHQLLAAYDEIFSLLKEVVEKGSLDQHLFTQPLVPLFKIR